MKTFGRSTKQTIGMNPCKSIAPDCTHTKTKEDFGTIVITDNGLLTSNHTKGIAKYKGSWFPTELPGFRQSRQ